MLVILVGRALVVVGEACSIANGIDRRTRAEIESEYYLRDFSFLFVFGACSSESLGF